MSNDPAEQAVPEAIPEPVIVGQQEIPAADIAAEAQNHPSDDAQAAWHASAEALAVKYLLLAEAKQLGLTTKGAKDVQGRSLTQEDALIEAVLDQEIDVPQADEATCRRFYDQHQSRFTSPTLIEAEHILFAIQPDDQIAMGMAVSDARGIIKELGRDASAFGRLAAEHSACPSAKQGGNLGQIGPGQTVEPFEEALFALGEGELCPNPVKSRFGVHVIRAGRRAESSKIPFEDAEQQIGNYLEEASYRRAVAQYIAILAGKIGVSGVSLGSADGAMVQ